MKLYSSGSISPWLAGWVSHKANSEVETNMDRVFWDVLSLSTL